MQMTQKTTKKSHNFNILTVEVQVNPSFEFREKIIKWFFLRLFAAKSIISNIRIKNLDNPKNIDHHLQ